MKYFSMFSGIGGFELGIERAHRKCIQSGGFKPNDNGHKYEQERTRPTCIGYSEIDKHAIKVYKKHFGEHKNYGDATRIIPEQLPDFDILVGGFPCQAFSIAGKRKGFNDTRGTLFFEIARILEVKRPRWVLLENVKGLLSHDNYTTIFEIFRILSELGYTVSWEVLNSKYFDVPQNRERVFIFGFREGSKREIFPIGEGNAKNEISPKRIGNMDGFLRYNQVFDKGGVTEALDTSGGVGHQPCIISHHPRQGDPQKGGTGALKSSESSFALDSSPHLVDGIRRLTPLECERLQGFPDNWTEGISDTQRYKCIGNAVTVNVIEAIFMKLFDKTA